MRIINNIIKTLWNNQTNFTTSDTILYYTSKGTNLRFSIQQKSQIVSFASADKLFEQIDLEQADELLNYCLNKLEQTKG